MQVKIDPCLNGYLLIIGEMRLVLSQEMLDALILQIDCFTPMPGGFNFEGEATTTKVKAVKKARKKPIKKTVAKPAKKTNSEILKPYKVDSGEKWSRKYDKCVMCGSTEHKHKSSGFCIKCYSPQKVKVYKSGGDPNQVKQGRKWGGSKWSRTGKQTDDQPSSSCSNCYKCSNCEEEFVSVLDLMDVQCPACGSNQIVKN